MIKAWFIAGVGYIYSGFYDLSPGRGDKTFLCDVGGTSCTLDGAPVEFLNIGDPH
jgi:hypothetical protein